jgi:multidrug efflux pump subunit AcrA (membrane-fusion protein)
LTTLGVSVVSARVQTLGADAVDVFYVQTVAGTSRVYVVADDHVEERIVTTGQASGDRVEITSGLKAGDVVASGTAVAKLADGTPIASHQ